MTLRSKTDTASGKAAKASSFTVADLTFFKVVLKIEREARLRVLALKFWRNLFLEDLSFGKGDTSFNISFISLTILERAKSNKEPSLTQMFSRLKRQIYYGRIPQNPEVMKQNTERFPKIPKWMPINYTGEIYISNIAFNRRDHCMGFWVIPFVGVSLVVLGVLSFVVVEYQDQKARRFESFRQIG